MERHEAIAAVKKLFAWETCLHPEAAKGICSRKIARAHTIQRAKGLARIARDGHVYCMTPRSLETIERNSGRVGPELVGINKASTFTGFCTKHDSALFRSFEHGRLARCKEHAFLLGYRAICRELYNKEQQVRNVNLLRAATVGGSEAERQFWQQFVQLHEFAVILGRDQIRRTKDEYDQILRSGQWTQVRACWIGLEETPQLLVSGAIFPEYDFAGFALNNLRPDRRDAATVAVCVVIDDDGRGAVVLTWLDGEAPAEYFGRSLYALPKEAIPHAIVRLIFEYFENNCMAPTWWEQLADTTKDRLLDRLTQSVHPLIPRNPNCLSTDDGVRAVNWTVVEPTLL
jgi:hypothetical protein